MSNTLKRQSGFTIVELLIVIVVIGILAAITIVAFNGIQNRANDSAVVSDLANIAKKYELYKLDEPSSLYPYGSGIPNITISKSAYDSSVSYNLLNCTSSTTQGVDYAMMAISKSGKRLYVSSTSGGVKEYTGGTAWGALAMCTTVLTGSQGNGAGYASGAWRNWTN